MQIIGDILYDHGVHEYMTFVDKHVLMKILKIIVEPETAAEAAVAATLAAGAPL